jgi:DNA replication protein DnaC
LAAACLRSLSSTILYLSKMLLVLCPEIIMATLSGMPALTMFLTLEDELDHRKSRLTQTRFKASGLKEQPTLTEFDWAFNPKLPKAEIYELVTGKFIGEAHDALLIGSPGTGNYVKHSLM